MLKLKPYYGKVAPLSLDDALKILDDLFPIEEKEYIKTNSENCMHAYHMSVGMMIRNQWGFWKGNGALFDFFKLKGIVHPDDMSGIILKSYWRQMNHVDIDLDQQIEYYKNYWKYI